MDLFCMVLRMEIDNNNKVKQKKYIQFFKLICLKLSFHSFHNF